VVTELISIVSIRAVTIGTGRALPEIGEGWNWKTGMSYESNLNLENGARNWFAVRVLPRHEKMVNSVLGHKGFETFLPMYSRRHRYPSRARCFDLPLFPGYLFCRLHLAGRLPILTTPGVIQMVGAGRTPIAVDEQEIVALQRAVESHLPLTPVSGWQAGQRGRITDGPLAGLEGAIVRVKATVRLVLSVTLLQRSVCVEIDHDRVALV
jgi:transcription termination/antitermination protein NusG